MALDLDARPGVRDRPGLRFTPGAGEEQLPPSGARGRARANLEAIRLLQLLTEQKRDATDTERAQLARWSGRGAVAELFDEHRQEWQHDREQLRALVGEDGYAQARRTTTEKSETLLAQARTDAEQMREAALAGAAAIVDQSRLQAAAADVVREAEEQAQRLLAEAESQAERLTAQSAQV